MNPNSAAFAQERRQSNPVAWLSHLPAALQALNPDDSPHQWHAELTAREFDLLPLPGSGNTLLRWQALAAVASHDLSLAKLYEGHTDALAITAELGATEDSDAMPRHAVWGVWGVWAAESRRSKVTYERLEVNCRSSQVKLSGTKTW